MKQICVFCGSNYGFKSIYKENAIALGRVLVDFKQTLVYGGGNVGLMKVIADTVLAGNGSVIGVIPEMLRAKEISHNGLTELKVVNSMHERKALMAKLSDAFIALPGGFGTFEESLEMITWTQLGLHKKPIGLLNVNGYYDNLILLINKGVEEGFIKKEHASMVISEDDPNELLKKLIKWRPIEVKKWI